MLRTEQSFKKDRNFGFCNGFERKRTTLDVSDILLQTDAALRAGDAVLRRRHGVAGVGPLVEVHHGTRGGGLPSVVVVQPALRQQLRARPDRRVRGKRRAPLSKKKKRCWKRCRIDVDVPRFSADSAGVDNQFPAWLANYTAFPHDASFCSAPKCMLQSWSLAVDMQQFVLATALLPALLPAPSTRLLRWSACGLAIALLPPFAATLVGGWPPMLVWSARALQNPFAEPMFYALYVPTQFRGAPYVVGVVAGCVLLRLKVCIVPLLVLGLSIPPVC